MKHRALSSLFSVSLSLLLPIFASAAEWRIETIAGTGTPGHRGNGGPALQAELDNPFGIVRGPDGNFYFAEYTGHRIRRLGKDGTVTTIAGTGEAGHTGDGGPALEATFNKPHEIRFDAAGDLYIVDMVNHAVRKIEMATGLVRAVAGTGEAGYSGDGGPALEARLKNPHSIQFGPGGDLYVCDIGNHVIRRIDLKTGTIHSFAGTGKPGPTPDGAPIAGTPLKGPRSIDFDREGNLWLATREGNQVFKFDLAAGVIHHVAGTGKSGFTGHGGPAVEANLSGPKGISVDAGGNVWLADCESHSIRRIDAASGRIDLIAGTGKKGDGTEADPEDGDPLKCRLARPHGIFADADGGIYVGDSECHKIRVLRKR